MSGALVLPRAESQAGCPRAVGFHRLVEWSSDSEGESSGRGLYLYECDPNGWNSRLLVETATGARVVLTGTLDARHGREYMKLQDDVSGWWIASQRNVRLRGKDLSDFLRKAYDQLEPGPGRSTLYKVTSSGGFALELEVPIRGHSESDWGQILEATRSAGLDSRLAAQLPVGVKEAMPLLRALPAPAPGVESTGQTISYPSILLAGVHPPAITKRAEVHETAGPIEKGLVLTAPELLDFASRFRSVNGTEPLADHRLAAVLTPGDDPETPDPHR
jgi:hypothetical protein